ncbi:DUF747-domain-containing protein [Annulohypoxylon maeteangense]|uniref:DUF747-domain-containing protein n=1 Tax=Annulohypoxylon maeteangense TaxID=1927788 RepID=UPI0020076A36|nr:DUF747-domain-containing protein [Annulohypoxylon maeteangense]KAI0887714.1 DUF747-domain-containing protein [Annulohypoxylon maeteangense]
MPELITRDESEGGFVNDNRNNEDPTSSQKEVVDDRCGRSLEREKQYRDTSIVKAEKYPTPPADPFPTLEIISSTPVTPKFDGNESGFDSSNINEKSMINGSKHIHSLEEHSAPGNSYNGSGNGHGNGHVKGHSYSSITTPSISDKAVPNRPADSVTKPRTQSTSKSATKKASHESVRKLSASQMQALTSSPDSLPIAIVSQRKPNGTEYPMSAGAAELGSRPSMAEQLRNIVHTPLIEKDAPVPAYNDGPRTAADFRRPPASQRTLSTPPINRRSSTGPPTNESHSTRRNSFNPLPRPPPLNLSFVSPKPPVPPPKTDRADPSPPSPILPTVPLPPMSLPTHLQLELAGQRPSPLYIHHSQSADTPYESSAVKFERLLNALLLPPYLERILTFGTLACLDAWLYTFTILPMRFLIALGVLLKWWAYVIWKEARWVVGYVWQGTWRLWQRGKRGRAPSRHRPDSSHAVSESERSESRTSENRSTTHQNGTTRHRTSSEVSSISGAETSRLNGNGVFHPPKHPMPRPGGYRHRRTKSMPSNLTSYHKADLLQGFVLICSAMALMNLDASRMYHVIRAQSSMKLYVIYNILEVGDRLLSAVGQDILECLFSSETLSRNSSGRSKVLLPFGMFILSLVYNVIHTMCLFYQVITLNVAVNSYSNSLLTLLISNQFVEIKGSVFKRIEKENLFQLTCSDVVERFQLWIILLIIGMRNVVEVGGLSVVGAGSDLDGGAVKPGPVHTSSSIPNSFTVLPSWILSGEVLSPFLVVIGIEMMVDWIKHAYINKFNNVKPKLYNRMLDILCKDYYTNAFSAPSLTRRLGLPVLPLSCLFIRASVQVYHMFLATHLSPPIPTSTTELSVESSTPSSPAMIAALEHLDTLLRNALGRAVYGYPYDSPHVRPFWTFSSDDAIALLTMVIFFFLAWVVLLIVKLLLGMALLHYSRERYASMKCREHAAATGKAEPENFSQPGKRIGSWGAVEIGDDRRKCIYEDDKEGLKKMRDRERKTEEKFKEKGDDGLSKVVRYEMVAKRIW